MGGSPCFSWMWPLPLTWAILLLSMGPGGSGTDAAWLRASGPQQQREEAPVPAPATARHPPTDESHSPGVILTPVIPEMPVSWARGVRVKFSQGEGLGAPKAHLLKSDSQKGLGASLDPAGAPSMVRWGGCPVPGDLDLI